MEEKKGTNKSTFRERRENIKAGQAFQFLTVDTKPNFFVITNNSASTIYVGQSPTTDSTRYDVIVRPFAVKIYAKPTVVDALYLFPTLDSFVHIQSLEKEYDPSMVQQTQEVSYLTGGGLNAVVQVDGFLNALPEGTNNLGKVIVTAIPAVVVSTLPSVVVSTLPAVNLVDSVFISQKITLVAGVDYLVKGSAGLINFIVSTLTDVLVKDGATETLLCPAGSFTPAQPIKNNTSIILRSAVGGVAYVSFK